MKIKGNNKIPTKNKYFFIKTPVYGPFHSEKIIVNSVIKISLLI